MGQFSGVALQSFTCYEPISLQVTLFYTSTIKLKRIKKVSVIDKHYMPFDSEESNTD